MAGSTLGLRRWEGFLLTRPTGGADVSEAQRQGALISIGWPTRFEKFVLALMVAILLYQLIVPPTIGLANNGDFERFMGRLGLRHIVTEYSDKYFNYINRQFAITDRNWWRSGYLSSENLFMEMALLLSQTLSKSGLFELELLGVVHAGGLVLAVWLMLVAARGLGSLTRLVVALLLVLIFTDVGYVAYLNSLYSEPASLIFLLLAVALLLLCTRSKEANPALPLAYLLAAALFVGAKPQNGLLGFPLAAVGICQVRHVQSWPWKRMVLTACTALCVVSVVMFATTPTYQRGNQLYNVIFFEVLRNSPSPEQDLLELGLDAELAEYAGTISYMPESAINDAGFPVTFFASLGWSRVLRLYLRHPERLLDLASRGARSAFSLRPDGLGNFEKAAGFEPRALSRAFDIWSEFKAQVVPGSLAFLLACLGLNLVLAVVCMRRDWRPWPPICRFPEVLLLLVIMSAMAFGTAVIGEGELDIVKHMFLFNVITDLIFVLDIAVLGEGIRQACRGRTRARTSEAILRRVVGEGADG